MILVQPSFLVVTSVAFSVIQSLASGLSLAEPIRNANHIFNAIHHSMRQWGSTLDHNGMSLFIATVPAGTLLYHGGATKEPVTGLEWLAFEPDHATNFAGLTLSPMPLPPRFNLTHGTTRQQYRLVSQQGSTASSSQGSEPIVQDPVWRVPGALHVYSAKHDLRLLYIDGSAAAKSRRGTLDSTDLWILNDTSLTQFNEKRRAAQLCETAKSRWKGQIEGFIRMEAGFEIIMCSFQDSLDLDRVGIVPDMYTQTNLSRGEMIFPWIRAASRRYDGIGGSPPRVSLDYESFVTAYASPMQLFQRNENIPRIDYSNQATLLEMRLQLDRIVAMPLSRSSNGNGVNWQALTDMVVLEFGDALQYLVTLPSFSKSGIRLAQELTIMLRGFIDLQDRQRIVEINRCVQKFVPGSLNESSCTAHRAIHAVTDTICTNLFQILDSLPRYDANLRDDTDPSEQLENLHELITYLNWSVWKRCRGCGFGEICMIPMFPFGKTEDWKHPSCKKADQFDNQDDYWQT